MRRESLQVVVGEGGLEEDPGFKEELRRRLLVAEVAWACWTSAAQRFCAVEQRRGVGVAGGGCGVESWGLKEGWGGI